MAKPDVPTETESNRVISNAREPRCELIDAATREVWQDFEPTPRDWYDALELEAPLAKAGYGAGAMDRAWFRRSPGASEDGPVRTREIAGRRFFHCATPVRIEAGPPRHILVDKHHSLAFDAGREIEILRDAEGRDYVLVVAAAEGTPPSELPDGWRVRTHRLAHEWIVELPAPTQTWWFAGMASFQGPVDVPTHLELAD